MSEKIETVRKTKSNKRNKKILVTASSMLVVLGFGYYGVNQFITYRHNLFLERYANAVFNINNKFSAGYKDAFSTLKEVCNSDDATSDDYYYLGYLYQYGLGTNVDYTQAFQLYRKSTSPNAYYELGMLYLKGNGVNRDMVKSEEYFHKAYEKGDKRALLKLAEIYDDDRSLIRMTDPKLLFNIYEAYDDGQIITKNPNIKYSYLAAAGSYSPALLVQAKLLLEQKRYAQAYPLLEKLAKDKNRKISDAAKQDMDKINAIMKAKRDQEAKIAAEIAKKAKAELEWQMLLKDYKDTQIAKIREASLNIPKIKYDNLSGLRALYINKLDSNNQKLFHENLLNIDLKYNLFNKVESVEYSYINKFMNIADKLNHNSSIWYIEPRDNNSNKYEGITSYLYNNHNPLIRDILTEIIKNKPKTSKYVAEIPKYVEPEPSISENTAISSAADKINKPQFSHKELMQRDYIYAQKGDYKALYRLRQQEKKGDVYAMYYLGDYYMYEKDYDQAIELYKEAAKKGYGEAYYKLGNIYYSEEDNGVPYNKETAIDYYKKAAAYGIKNAQNLLNLIN